MPERYGLVAIVGPRENGKSTFLVRDIRRELASKKNYNKGFINIPLTQSPGVTFINYAGLRTLNAQNENGVPDMIVGLDQIHKYCDARRSGSKENVEFCETLIESRQHGFDLIVDTWGISSIDPRLRKYLELLVQAEKRPDGFYYRFIDPQRDMANAVIKDWTRFTFEQAQATVWPYYQTTYLVEDDSLTKIARAPKDERKALAKKLAVFKPCK